MSKIKNIINTMEELKQMLHISLKKQAIDLKGGKDKSTNITRVVITAIKKEGVEEEG